MKFNLPIGAGGMGEVYRARDARLSRDVAIKILPASFSADPERLQRFAQESRAAAALNHPNILSIFDIGEEHGAPYVVSELLEGETLRDRLRNGAAHFTQSHRLRPANRQRPGCRARKRNRPSRPEAGKSFHHQRRPRQNSRLRSRQNSPDPEADSSGDAPTIQAATEAGTVMGTAGYMAPEQVRGKRRRLPLRHLRLWRHPL